MLPPPSDDNRYADLVRRIRQLETALRSSFTTISGGAGIRIVDGGRLALVSADDVTQFYIGPVLPHLADGSPQPGWFVCRADGSMVLDLVDAFPDSDGAGLNQALNWRDRGGGIVFADDTNSGQGIARPYLPIPFYRSRQADWPTTTSTGFETMYRAKVQKQQPRATIRVWGACDAGATGELKVMINGDPFGAVKTINPGSVTEYTFGADVVAGAHMSALNIEIQARLASGTGSVRCCPSQGNGQQS